MTDFSTSALLELQVSQSSLKSARQTIESELGGAEVDVAATAASGGGASGSGGLAAAGLDTANTHLSAARDHLSENITLNEERNTLLREILDAQEMAAQSSGSNGGRLPSRLLGGGLGILGGLTVALASVNWTGVVTGAIDKITASVSDFLKRGGKAAIDAADLVANKASVGAGDVVNTTLSLSATDVIAAGATIGAGALVASAATVSAPVLVASAATVGAGALIADKANISVTDVISSPAEIAAPNLIAATATVTVGSLIAEKATVTLDKLVEVANGGSSSSSSGSGSSSNTGSSSGSALSFSEIIAAGGSAAGLNALLSSSSGGLSIGGIVGRSAGVTSPLLTRSMMPRDEDGNLVGSQFPAEDGKKTNREVILSWLGSGVSAIGADVPGPQPGKVTLAPGATLSGGGVDPSEWETWQERNESGGSSSRGTPNRNGTTVEANVTNEVEATIDLSNMRDLKEFLRDPPRYIERNLDLPGGR